MRDRCYWACQRTANVSVQSSGLRDTFFYPGGGSYRGYWLNNKHHGYGVKTTKKDVIYDGQWLNGKRHGYGTMRRPVGKTYERTYMGEWKDDMKCGEGKQFYEEGTYYGWWFQNRRHGVGIMWYKNGQLYIGEWQADAHHGLGVLFYSNGNRYEGCFARGYKNGEGTFYHMHTGQIQKGMWEFDVCKTSLVQDDFRHQVTKPTEYPVPKNRLLNPDDFIWKIFNEHRSNEWKPHRSFKELAFLNYVRKAREFARLQPHAVWNTRIPTNDVVFPCVCKKNEKLVTLREV